MEFIEIAEYCTGQLKGVEKFLNGRNPFKEVYKGPMDAHSIVDFLHRRNFELRDELSKMIDRFVKDLIPFDAEPELLLFLKIRIECAIFNLSLLNQTLKGRGSLHHDADDLDDVLVWALTGLWDFGCYSFMGRVARSYAAGLTTSLQPNIPGTIDPDWMTPAKKR